MNKLRKTLVLSLACLLLLTTFAAGALASIQAQPYTFNGQCLRTFTTSGSLTKPSANRWQQFMVQPGSLSYAGSTEKDYAYARPVNSDDTVIFASMQKIYTGDTTYFYPNTTGMSANTVKFKIYNAHYEDDQDQNHRLTISGTVRGVYN